MGLVEKKNYKYYSISAKEPIGILDREEKKTSSGFEGTLIGVELKKYKFEDKENDLIQLNFDNNEALSFSLTNVSRSIINALLSSNDGTLERLYISVYENPKTGYASASVSNNGQKLSWKYEFTVLDEKVEKIMNKNKEIIKRDYTELDNWMLELLKTELPKKIKYKNLVDELDELAKNNIEKPVKKKEKEEDEDFKF